MNKNGIGLELEKMDGREELVGRDPRQMNNEELTELGHEKMPILDIIRAKCLDCSAGQTSEIRRCTAIKCMNWPYRMGTNPWREKKEISEEHKQKLKDSMAKARAAKENPWQ